MSVTFFEIKSLDFAFQGLPFLEASQIANSQSLDVPFQGLPFIAVDPLTSITFVEISQNHRLYVDFIPLNVEPDPLVGTVVTFNDVDEDHEVEVLFEYKPYPALDSNTVLLLHFAGTEGTRLYVDSSLYEHEVSCSEPSSTSQLSRTQKKWGKTSCLLGTLSSGTTNAVSASISELTDDSDFTVDFWVYPISQTDDTLSIGHAFFEFLDTTVQLRFDVLRVNGVDHLRLLVIKSEDNQALFSSSLYTYTDDFIVLLDSLFPEGVTNELEWVHFAVVRYEGTTTIYVNGVALPETISGYIVGFSSINIGRFFNGYIDEFRISKSARWTTDFTLPIGPYSDIPDAHEFRVEFDMTLVLQTSPTALFNGSYIRLLLHMDGTEGSQVFTDHSVYNRTITVYDDAHLTEEANIVGGDEGVFNGNYSNLSVPDSDDWNFVNGDFTIDFWVKIDQWPASDRVGFFVLGDNPEVFEVEYQWLIFPGITVRTGSATRSMLYRTGNADFAYYDMEVGGVVPNGLFGHVAIVKTNGLTRVFINGIKAQQENSADLYGFPFVYQDYPNQFWIGKSVYSKLVGCMRFFRVSKGIARWTDNFDPASIQYYPLDSYVKLLIPMSGTLGSTIFQDVGPSAYTVTNSGVVYIGSTANTFGGSSGKFNGTADYLSVPDSSHWAFGTIDFTIDFRVKFDPRYEGKIQVLFSQGTRGTTNFFSLEVDALSTAKFVVRVGLYALDFELTGWTDISLTDLEWHHIALIHRVNEQGTYKKLYLHYDGISQSDEVITGQTHSFVDIDAPFLIGTDGLYFFQGYLDEFRISCRAEWSADFTPPVIPYIDPVSTSPPGFTEIPLVEFDAEFSIDTHILKPGEHEISFDSDFDLSCTIEIHLPELQFESSIQLSTLLNERTASFVSVLSNRWLKELFDSYGEDQTVSGDYRVALMQTGFIFNPDTHEYFIDQVDQYEITVENGYVSGQQLVFNEISQEGVLSFQDFEFEIASSNSYGPTRSLLIYDYNLDDRGLIVGCMTFDDTFIVSNAIIKLSGLSFQIV